MFLVWDGPLLGFRLVGHEKRDDHPSNFSQWAARTRELKEFYAADLAVHLVYERGEWKEFGKSKRDGSPEAYFFHPTVGREVKKCPQLDISCAEA